MEEATKIDVETRGLPLVEAFEELFMAQSLVRNELLNGDDRPMAPIAFSEPWAFFLRSPERS